MTLAPIGGMTLTERTFSGGVRRRCRALSWRDSGSYTLTIQVENRAGSLLGGATLEVWQPRGRPFTAADNGALDEDPTEGIIRLDHVQGGYYRVRQVTPPRGYELDTTALDALACPTDDPSTPEDETRPSVIFVSASRFFVEVAEESGLSLSHGVPAGCDVDTMGIAGGGAWGDVDNDGDLDLFVTDLGPDEPNHLYRNNGDGTFTDITSPPVDGDPPLGGDPHGRHLGAVFVDYDNDGDQDLFVTRVGGVNLYRNQAGDFTDFTDQAGLAGLGMQRFTNFSFGDYDNDGFVDAFLTAHVYCTESPNQGDHLFHNNGDGTFAEVTDYLNANPDIPSNIIHSSFTSVWFDFDMDGDLDIYVANDAFKNRLPQVLWRNDGPDEEGGWRFVDASVAVGVDKLLFAMGAGIGDYNLDGCPDLVVSNIGPAFLWENQCDGTFENRAARAGIDRGLLEDDLNPRVVTWGSGFIDHDNDGDQDLMLVAGDVGGFSAQRNLFFRNNGDLSFTEISSEAGVNGVGKSRALAFADYDGNGFVDMFVGGMSTPPRLYRNMGEENANPNHWLQVKVVGKGLGPGTTNRDGIGSHITVSTADGRVRHWWVTSGAEHGSGSAKIAHFGLGDQTVATVEVIFPSGAEWVMGKVPSDQRLTVTEP